MATPFELTGATGAEALDAPAGMGRASPGLVVCGALMLLGAFITANPWTGATATRWPWEILASGPVDLRRLNWILWFATALLAVLLGLTQARAVRAPLLLALAVVLLLTCQSGMAGLQIESVTLAWTGGLGLLLAGLLLAFRGGAEPAARALSALGGLAVLWTLLVSFNPGPDPERPAQSELLLLLEHLGIRLRGQAIPDARPNYDEYLWAYGLGIAAAALGLAALVRVRGAIVSGLGLSAVLLLYLIPTGGKVVRTLQAGSSVDVHSLSYTFSELLIHSGFVLVILFGVALADAARLCASPRAGEGP